MKNKGTEPEEKNRQNRDGGLKLFMRKKQWERNRDGGLKLFITKNQNDKYNWKNKYRW